MQIGYAAAELWLLHRDFEEPALAECDGSLIESVIKFNLTVCCHVKSQTV